ncbi:MAG: DUF4230 domain-containing protein, partial [Gillisia sp.]
FPNSSLSFLPEYSVYSVLNDPMRKLFLVLLLILLLFFGYKYYQSYKQQEDQLLENTELIQNQIRNVGKLVVIEGNFAQVYTYKDTKKFYLDVLSANKKALIVVNAKVNISYDLSKLKTIIDSENKTLNITYIPKEEISINPNLKYYDVSQDYLNKFDASDYNKIRKNIEKSLRKKIEKSALKAIAQNRLISELQKIYILTNSMGWKLEYKGNVINNDREIESLKL